MAFIDSKLGVEVLGAFNEKDFGMWFEYCENTEENANEFPHLICVGNNLKHCWDFRYAKVLKTIAYIIVDEDDSGNPIVEKWQLKNHRTFC